MGGIVGNNDDESDELCKFLAVNHRQPTAASASLEIPRPNTVPHRKSSIFEPSVNSKLSPQPLQHMHPAGDMHLSVDE